MLRHRRVAMVAGLVGALFALVLPFAITSPAWALNDNVVTVTKVVNGTPAQLGNFEVVVTCDDGPGGQPAQTQTLTFAPTGGTQSATFDPAFISCTVVETQTRGADSSTIQAVSPTAVIQVPNGNNATVPISILFKAGPQPPGAAQTVNVGITNTFIPRNPNIVNVTKTVVGDAPAGSFFQINVVCGPDTVSLLFTAAGGTKPAAFPSSCSQQPNTNPPAPAVTVEEVVASPGLGVVPALQQITYSNTGGAAVLTCPVSASCGAANFGAFPAGVGGGNSKAVTVTNRYASPNPPNTITVTKRVRGRVPAPVTGFRIVVTCKQVASDPQNNPNTIVQEFTFPTVGGTHDFVLSKEYRDCNVKETPLPVIPPAGVEYQGTITPANGTLTNAGLPNNEGVNLVFALGGNKSAAVTVTNRYPGDNVLTVTKQTLGQVPPGSLFLVRVDCTNNFDNNPLNNTFPGPNGVPANPNNPNPIPNPPQASGSVWLLFGAGQPVTQQIADADEAAGTDDRCQVVETVSGGASQVVYGATADDPDTILSITQPPPGLGGVLVAWPLAQDPVGDDAQVVITNRFTPCPAGQPKCTTPGGGPIPTNEIVVKKRIRGDAPNPPSFTLRLRCSGGGVVEERLLTFTNQVIQTVLVPATRSNCVLTETVNGGAATVEYFAKSRTGADATYGATSARVDFTDTTGVTGGGHARLQVTNRFPGTCPPSSPKYC